jgi:hypothetical protein
MMTSKDFEDVLQTIAALDKEFNDYTDKLCQYLLSLSGAKTSYGSPLSRMKIVEDFEQKAKLNKQAVAKLIDRNRLINEELLGICQANGGEINEVASNYCYVAKKILCDSIDMRVLVLQRACKTQALKIIALNTWPVSIDQKNRLN